MEKQTEHPIDRFLQWVADIARKDDRGTLAELRRGLSPTTQDQAWEHIIRFAKSDFADDDRRAVWCSIGGLAALLFPKGLATNGPGGHLGSMMQRLAFCSIQKPNPTHDEKMNALKHFSPRLRRMLDASDTVSLCEMAVRTVRMAFNKEVPVNLRELFSNLKSWDDYNQREKTRLKWAQQYYRVFEPRPDAPSAAEEAAP